MANSTDYFIVKLLNLTARSQRSNEKTLCVRHSATRTMLMMLAVLSVLLLGCEKNPRLLDYRDGGLGVSPESAPIILVGKIIKHAYVGDPYPSHWYPDQPFKLCRVTVRVENVIRGNVGEPIVPIYYLIGLRLMGHARMGMVGRGGNWKLGDRAIFFLRRDSGVLRTIYDTWASATPTVLTGAHPNYKAQPGESIADSVIDILLDRGEGCSNAQWAHAISVSTAKAEFFDLAYTVRRLRQIMATHTPDAREAAEKELDELSYSWPKIRQGWPETEKKNKQ